MVNISPPLETYAFFPPGVSDGLSQIAGPANIRMGDLKILIAKKIGQTAETIMMSYGGREINDNLTWSEFGCDRVRVTFKKTIPTPTVTATAQTQLPQEHKPPERKA